MQLAALSHNYIFLTFLALALFTAFNILSNVFTQKSKDQQAFAIIFNGIASALALILFLINQHGELFQLNMTSGVLLLIPVAPVILYTFTDLIRFVPVKHLPPSTLQIVGTVSTVVSLIMSYFYTEMYMLHH